MIDFCNKYRIYGGYGTAMFAPGVREAMYEFSRVAKCGRAEE